MNLAFTGRFGMRSAGMRHCGGGVVRPQAVLTAMLLVLSGLPAVGAKPTKAGGETSHPAVSVFYVPQKDLHRAPGYTGDGAFLSFADLRRLAAAAEANDVLTSQASVYCRSIVLRGTASEALRLQGTIEFQSTGNQWCAVPVDDGHMPWVTQSSVTGAKAFLARVRGKTYLYADGSGAGTLSVEAFYPSSFSGSEAQLNFGRFFSPARIDLEAAPGIHVVKAEQFNVSADARAFSLWPNRERAQILRLRRSSELRGQSLLRISQMRTVSISGNVLEVQDQFNFQDRFTSASSFSLKLPPGLSFIDAETSEPVRIRLSEGAVLFRPLLPLGEFTARVSTYAAIEGNTAELEKWTLPGAVVRSRLVLRDSETMTPVLTPVPDQLFLASVDERRRTFDCWGELPNVRLKTTPSVPTRSPELFAFLDLQPGEAVAHFRLRMRNEKQSSIRLALPAEWSLVDFAVKKANAVVPSTLFQQDDTNWQASWDDKTVADEVAFDLRRSGAWGEPGTTSTIGIPFPYPVGPLPNMTEVQVNWPANLDVRPGELSRLKVIPVTESHAAAGETTPSKLALRATAERPEGNLLVNGRESDVRATVVTSLSVGEDRAVVRSMIEWNVRLAPENTFRVLLPPGTGRNVKFDDRGLRESVMHVVPGGEEWTFVTQNRVLGQWSIALEWPLETTPGVEPIQAPQIHVQDVAAQQGYLLLEAAEALHLSFDTSNLTEADLIDVPNVPWAKENRALAAFHYIEPPYTLSVRAERVKTEPGIGGLVREARLRTTFAHDGERLTHASYTVAPGSERQFFELGLPEKARLWSVLVDGEGTKPGRRKTTTQSESLLIPLQAKLSGDSIVTILYAERSRPLVSSGVLRLAGPKVFVPVNRSVWNLNLPPGFEYLSFNGGLSNLPAGAQPLVAFLRTAFYPRAIIFPDVSTRAVLIFTFIGSVIALFVMKIRKRRATMSLGAQDEAEPREVRRGCGTILELLIILGIIAVLASIATPNFLEAQSRAKVSRVKNDMRSMASGIEAYYVDNNAYPPNLDILSQGAVKYITSSFSDPFNDIKGATFGYVQGMAAYEKAARAGFVDPSQPQRDFWILYSPGPDAQSDEGELQYDPTNGTVSPGDVIRIKNGGSSWDSSYGAFKYDPTNGTVSAGDVYRVKQGADEPAPPHQVARGEVAGAAVQTLSKEAKTDRVDQAGLPTPEEKTIRLYTADGVPEQPLPAASPSPPQLPVLQELPDVTIGEVEDNKGADNNYLVFNDAFRFDDYVADADGDRSAVGGKAARRAGLLSLEVEIPEGGVERTMEGLGGDARAEIRFMDEINFKQLRFSIRMTLFLLLAVFFVLSRRLYRFVFVCLLGATLLAPLFTSASWVPFFNAATEGILLSLLIPSFAVVLRRLTRQNPTTPFAAIVAGFLLMTPNASRAADSSSLPTSPSPAAIIVPYDTADALDSASTGSAYISRRDFARLWNAAYPDAATSKPAAAMISGCTVEGTLDSAASSIRGTIRISAVNTGDFPATAPIALDRMILRSSSTHTTDTLAQREASLQGSASGLLIQLPPHWAGTVAADFELPCGIQGMNGSLRTSFPEDIIGMWSFGLPLSDLSTTSPTRSPHIVEKRNGAAVISGPMRPGLLEIQWTGPGARKTSPEESRSWRVDVETNATFDSLPYATWEARLHLKAEAGELLPGEITIGLDPKLHLSAADGESLLGSVTQESSITLRLARAAVTEVTLRGIFASDLPATSASTTVCRIPGLVFPAGIESRTHVGFAVSDRIEIQSVKSDGLQRAAGVLPRQGYATMRYETTAGDWMLELQLRRQLPVFDATVTEVVVPTDSFRKVAARIQLKSRGTILRECRVQLSPGFAVESITGVSVSQWVQSDQTLIAFFAEGVEESAELDLIASSAGVANTATLDVAPIRVVNAAEQKRTIALFVPADAELEEVRVRQATPQVPDALQKELLGKLIENALQGDGSLRSYALATADAQSFRLKPGGAGAAVTLFNRVTITEGLVNLDCLVQVEPRRGRVSQVTVILNLPTTDTRAASNLEPTGLVRNIRTEPISPGVLRVYADLVAPQSSRFDIRFSLDLPVNTDGTQHVPIPLFSGEEAVGVRSVALVHREIEGDLQLERTGTLRKIDPGEFRSPNPEFRPMPSDQAFELAAGKTVLPRFTIVRHARGEALRAVVEVLRQRNIVSADGTVRCELEIVLQNQSEQFLKIALPYPKEQLRVYEVLVAGRPVKIAFGIEGGREVLLVPLIRTGLLEPELAVRVAYSIQDAVKFAGSGQMEQRLPEILGGVPVAQSALVLMLPSAYDYAGFQGTLNPVELVDLEVDEARRAAKVIEKLSEVALYSKKGSSRIALNKLNEYQTKVEANVRFARQQEEAGRRMEKQVETGSGEADASRRRGQERAQTLKEAEEAQKKIMTNIAVLDQKIQQAPQQVGDAQQQVAAVTAQQMPGVQQQAQAVADVVPPAVETAAPLQFARVGEVFVFRQLQGTGFVRFRYSEKSIVEMRWDVALAAGLILIAGAVFLVGGRVFRTRRRLALVLLILFGAMTALGIIIDVAIPGIAAALLMMLFEKRQTGMSAPH